MLDNNTLYDTQRLKHHWVSVPFFLLYFPVGICLLVARLLLLVVMVLIVDNRADNTLRNRRFSFYLRCCGVFCVCRNRDQLKTSSANIVVSNHQSLIDSCFFAENNIGVVGYPINGNIVLETAKKFLFPSHYIEIRSERFVEEITEFVSGECGGKILIFPEGTIGSSKAVHKFQKYPFRLKGRILPVAIEPTWTFFVNPHPLNSDHTMNMLWLLFIPFTVFHYHVLPSVQRGESESTNDYALRVRHLIAREIGAMEVDQTFKHRMQLEQSL